MAEAETKKAKHETAEHVAWDCSDVVPRVRILARHCRQHLDKAKDTPDIQHELMVAMGNLVKVPAVALMLPAMSEELKAALREVSDKGIELLAAAETSLWDSPRMLFILSLRETDMRSPVAQLQGLLEAVAECTLKVKAKQGPWLWPLHEPDVSASLLLCDAMNDTENCCMRALRMMRILPSVCLKEQQQHIREQYSASTTYVFAWTEVYMQAMWALLILVVPLAIALPVVPDLLGASSWGFYTLQAIVLVWTMTLGALSRSRRAFVNDGSSLARSEKAVNWEHFDHSRRSKLRRVLQMTGTGNEFAEVVNVRQNPDHWHSENPKTWRFLSVAVTVLAGLLCLTLAGISLLAVMELKFMLIFEWGECFRLECIGPEDMHGFGGLLSMIGTDIILALLLNVATGELCKAFAFHIAKFWNFKQMISRQICFYITASSIDVLAGIGVFSYLAFSFLPEWEQTVVSSWDDSSMCVGMWDYDVCRVMRGCAEGDSVCCSGTLFCARAKAPVTQRRSLFEAWLGGLFMVAPFVEVLIQFLVPVLAYYIHLKVDHIQNDDERDPGRRKSCCCCFLEGLGRLVAFIFLLDGGVMGLPYVWRGYPFAAPNVQHEDPRKKAVLGPVCDGCKRDMHWTDADKDWSCRHHHRCRNDLASKGPERWCCRICQSDICGDCHPQGAQALNHLFGPLDQRLLRPFNPIDELKMLKMNFMIVVMFAPINPYGLIAQLLARLLDLHSRIWKLLMVRRRDSPMDNALAHASQKVFGQIILPFGAIWHVGLSLISFNVELYAYDRGQLVLYWALGSLCLAGLGVLFQVLGFKAYHWMYGSKPSLRGTVSSLGSSLDPTSLGMDKSQIIEDLDLRAEGAVEGDGKDDKVEPERTSTWEYLAAAECHPPGTVEH